MHAVISKLIRELILLTLFFLPQQKKITIERWLRGREEFRKLTEADCVVVSFGKSGRTWLHIMLLRFYQIKHGLSKKHLLGFQNLHRRNSEIPNIFFTHDNYIKDYTKNKDSKVDFYDKKVILLVRDPRDTAVSQFFQWKYRMKSNKKKLNDYPAHGLDITIFEFIMNKNAGLPKIIDFLNNWAGEMPHMQNILIVHYEDMRANPEETLRIILNFIETPGSENEIKKAIELASFENMKKLEEKRVFWLSGHRLLPGDRNNPNSYKVRRAKVGGYRDYFDEEQIAMIDELVHSTLSPFYGYVNNEKTNHVKMA